MISSLIESIIPFTLCSLGANQRLTHHSVWKRQKYLGQTRSSSFFFLKKLYITLFRADPGDILLEPCDLKSTNWSSLENKYVAMKEYSNCHIFSPLAFQKIKSPLLLQIAALYLRWDIDLNFLSFTLK